ncbi:hypothetical protein V2J09_002404 [Rumex salicifolius]
MTNSASDQGIYIESDEEGDEEKLLLNSDNDSDSSDYSGDRMPDSKPSSYNPSWPQSYRQSIDLYSSVPSPSVILGTPTLERFTGSILSSSLKQRHTPEIGKPFLPTSEDVPKRRSSHSLLPPISLKRSSHVKIDDLIVHEFPVSKQSTYGQAVLNGMNVLCGVGILSTPYAIKEGGWISLCILLVFAMVSYYTGILLRCCLDSSPGLETYPDIGQAAFGQVGRIILYVELYACCVEFIILESDNLSSLFPNAHLNLGFCTLDAQNLFAIVTMLAVLPTCWLRDLSVLSYVSAGGVVASVLVVLCLFWVGLVDQVGDYHGQGSALNVGTLPVALGLYGYCYSGHAVFPNIYTSMEKPNQYPSVLLTSFGVCTILYAGVAVLGYLMFGEFTQSQFTLNLPQELIASKIAVWTTELIPRQHLKSHLYPILIRTALVISILLVALSVPFFGLVMALIGSLLTMLVTLILPCACYLSILRGKVQRIQASVCILVIAVGLISSAFGTYSALSQIIERLTP